MSNDDNRRVEHEESREDNDICSSAEGNNDDSQVSDESRAVQEDLDDDGQGDIERDEALLGEIVDEVKDPKKKERIVSILSHRGPLPSSLEFANYENVRPGTADDIISMAKQNNEAITALMHADANKVRTDSRIDEKAVPRGQWLSFILTFSVLVIAVICAVIDFSGGFYLFGVGGIGLLVANVVPNLTSGKANHSKEVTSSQDLED